MKIGILGGADIAYNMFMPSVQKIAGIDKIIVASNSENRRDRFIDSYHVEVADTYAEVIEDHEVQLVYIPQPPAWHYKWAKMALENGKNVLLEKPFSISYKEAMELIACAQKKGLTNHENYMFQYHNQMNYVREIINKNTLGRIMLIKSNFGFPFRGEKDFRYNSELGGGALLDAGGYLIKLASILLGDSIEIDAATATVDHKLGVDLFGSFMAENKDGIVFQGAYGMDNSYQCCLELWGTKGRLYTNRIFTAKPDYSPIYEVEIEGKKNQIILEPDDHFRKSIKQMLLAMKNVEMRIKLYGEIEFQAKILNQIQKRLKIYEK